MPVSHGSVLLISDEAEVPSGSMLSQRNNANPGPATPFTRLTGPPCQVLVEQPKMASCVDSS